MKKNYRVLAIDFGASSGRAFLGHFDGQKLDIEEIHRFENNPVTEDGTLYWNIDALWSEVKTSLRAARDAGGFDSVAVDTWGVDFGLLDKKGKLTGRPVHYRDNRTDNILEKALNIIPNTEIYRLTGNQIIKINTLFQLVASKEEGRLINARTLLFMPDLFGYFLSGKIYCERTIASTSQMYNPVSLKWEEQILEMFGIPQVILPDVISSGTVVGELCQALCSELNFPASKVIAAAGHDTQCAIAAIPSNEPDAAFLSCGTWSLFGTELKAPVLSAESMKDDMSNELGANGKIDYLKNINGLWLTQESRREWKRQGNNFSFSDIEELAGRSEPFANYIDPDSPEFVSPGNIPEKIRSFCKRTGQTIPENVGAVARCINESLVMKYRFTLEQIQNRTGKKHHVLHMVGGGTQSKMLCQMTADSIGIPVIAGPVEATVFGNVIIQLAALGAIQNIDSGRSIIAENTRLEKYEPHDKDRWNAAYKQFLEIIKKEKEL